MALLLPSSVRAECVHRRPPAPVMAQGGVVTGWRGKCTGPGQGGRRWTHRQPLTHTHTRLSGYLPHHAVGPFPDVGKIGVPRAYVERLSSHHLWSPSGVRRGPSCSRHICRSEETSTCMPDSVRLFPPFSKSLLPPSRPVSSCSAGQERRRPVSYSLCRSVLK